MWRELHQEEFEYISGTKKTEASLALFAVTLFSAVAAVIMVVSAIGLLGEFSIGDCIFFVIGFVVLIALLCFRHHLKRMRKSFGDKESLMAMDVVVLESKRKDMGHGDNDASGYEVRLQFMDEQRSEHTLWTGNDMGRVLKSGMQASVLQQRSASANMQMILYVPNIYKVKKNTERGRQ